MDFKQFLGLSVFLLGAVFSGLDIGADILLARKYFLKSFGQDKDENCENFMYSYPTPHLQNNSMKSNNKITKKIRSQIYSRLEYSTIRSTFSNYLFLLTTTWIILGGFLQTIIIIRYKRARHTCLDPFSLPMRLILIFTAPFLLAPVFVNIFGAYLILRNLPNVNEDIVK